MIRVVIVCSSIPGKDNPLGGVFAVDQAKALKSKGIDVIIFAIDLRSIRHKRKYGLQKGIIQGINYYRYNFPMGRVPVSWRILIGRRILIHLYDYVYASCKQTTPDVIHAHFTEEGSIAFALSKEKRIPLVITEHNSAIMDENISGTLIKYARELYRGADGVIAVSRVLGKRVYEIAGVKPIIINNVVDLKVFNNCKCERRNKEFTFVTVSSLVPVKNHRLLIEAFIIFLERGYTAKLLIVGDGPERSNLEKLIKRFKINAHVVLVGYKKREEIASLLNVADCYVISSVGETFGVAGIEAMAAGLPVLSTKCGGPEEYINESNGILVDNYSSIKLAEGMIRIYNNINNFDKSSIRQAVIERFSDAVIAQKIIDVYRSIGIEFEENLD